MRDIGKKARVLAGSLYHHIKSKDGLFIELHHSTLDVPSRRIAAAVVQQSDPWSRLEAACVTLLETQLPPIH